MLDINKHVIFARNKLDHFMTRQIIVITDDNKLACYSVYPDANYAMLTLFAKYDIALAEHLGVEIATESADCELLLAHNWWDDSIWNPHNAYEDDD